MVARKKRISMITIFLALAPVLLMSGCAEKKPSEKVVATINGYKMTVEDFGYDSRGVLTSIAHLGGLVATKEDIIDALIIKELFLQEAQKMDLDKDKRFMKTIELYWEQTLIKNLLTKKSDDIRDAIAVYEGEILNYYNKMKQKIRAKVFILEDGQIAKKLLNFEGDIALRIKQDPEKYSFLYAIPSRDYELGENSSSLENGIFNIDIHSKREIIEIDGNWALVIVEGRTPSELEPLSVIKKDITRNLKMQKEKELMDQWIDALRSNARIRINRKVLEKLQ